MDFNKLYGLDDNGERLDKPKVTPPSVESPPLEPLDLSDATPVLLAKAIEAARKSTDPKVIIPVLDALLKRGHVQDSKERMHDIREVMGVMCPDCIARLEALCQPK